MSANMASPLSSAFSLLWRAPVSLIRAKHPVNEASLGPVESSQAVPAEEAEVAAVRQDQSGYLRRENKFLERLDGDKGIVSGGQYQCRDQDSADEGHGRGATVV